MLDQVAGSQVLDQVTGVQVAVDSGGSSGVNSRGESSGGSSCGGSSGWSSGPGSSGRPSCRNSCSVGASGRTCDVGSSGGNSDACGSSGRNRSDGCSDPGVIQTDIRLASNFSTLSGNQKVEILLNHITPGDAYEFDHQAVQKEANEWKLSVQRAWLTDFEWVVHSPVKGGEYCRYCFLRDHLTRAYTFARSGESTVG